MATVVRLRVAIVGAGFLKEPGELFVCDEETAARLVAAGAGELVGDQAPESMRREPAAERAVKPDPKPRR